jgi:hypothetical protein
VPGIVEPEEVQRMDRRLLSVCAAAMIAFAGCNDNQTPTTSQSSQIDEAASTTTAPATSAQIPVSTPAVFDSSAGLAERVSEAYWALTPPASTRRALAVLELRRVDDFMVECMAARGHQFARRTRNFPPGAFEITGAEAAWYAPPNRHQAAYGLGMAPSGQPIDPAFEAMTAQTLDLSADEEQAYDEVEIDCSSTIVDRLTFDWTPVNQILGEMRTIAESAKSKPGFGDLQRAYASCIASRGLGFDDPDMLLATVSNRYESEDDAEAVADFERAAATADAECRTPIWEEFLLLSDEEWMRFLDARSPEIASVLAGWASLEDEAGHP